MNKVVPSVPASQSEAAKPRGEMLLWLSKSRRSIYLSRLRH